MLAPCSQHTISNSLATLRIFAVVDFLFSLRKHGPMNVDDDSPDNDHHYENVYGLAVPWARVKWRLSTHTDGVYVRYEYTVLMGRVEIKFYRSTRLWRHVQQNKVFVFFSEYFLFCSTTKRTDKKLPKCHQCYFDVVDEEKTNNETKILHEAEGQIKCFAIFLFMNFGFIRLCALLRFVSIHNNNNRYTLFPFLSCSPFFASE